MAQAGEPKLIDTPDRDLFDHDDLVGFASPQSLAGRRREPAPVEAEPEAPPVVAAPIVASAPQAPPEPEAEPDLFDPPALPPEPPLAPIASAPQPAQTLPAQTLPAWARETAPAPRPQAAAEVGPAEGAGLYGVYALILFAVPTLGASLLLGLLASLGRGRPADPLAAGHFVFQRRTLWIGAIGALVGAGLVVVNLGVFVLFVLALWLIARGARGVLRLKAGRPIDNPRTWLI